MKTGAQLIAEERERQVSKEGWDADHDDGHTEGELASAAACYAAPSPIFIESRRGRAVSYIDPFPWGTVVHCGRAADDPDGWRFFTTKEMKKGKRRLRQLVIAGALIAAEIDRLQRRAGQ